MSSDFGISPLQDGAVSSSTLTESEPPPPPLPERSRKRIDNPPVEMLPPSDIFSSRKEQKMPPPTPPDVLKQSDGQTQRGKTLPAFGRKMFEMTVTPNENGHYRKTSASPNFVYLNSAHSKSVEVLSTLYATVDKSKKKKNREAAEERRRQEASKQRRKSRSHESLAGSPRLNSFSFTPFTFKGLAAMDSSSGDDQDFEMENAFISAKAPKAERVSMALRGSLNRDDESSNKGKVKKINDGKPSSAPSSSDVETLHRAIANSPRFGSKKKDTNESDSTA